MKYFIQLSYHGGRYHGWQRQANAISVQEVFEGHLSQLLNKKTHAIGCGRTDTGVHASQYFAHIKTEIDPGEHFVFRMNKILPHDIAVQRIFSVHEKAHAQHDAISRTYTYHLHGFKNPLLNSTSTLVDLDAICIDKINEALDFIIEHSNYKMLCKTPDAYKTSICNIQAAIYQLTNKDRATITITANRFLRAMMRLLVSKMIRIGSDQLPLERFKRHLIEEIPFRHYDPAPAQGLWLTRVTYNNSIISTGQQ